MIYVSTAAAQTLTTGQSLTFTLNWHTKGCRTCFRNNGSSITTAPNGVYLVHFNANITGTVAAGLLALSIQADGATVATMNSVPTVAGDLNAVSSFVPILNNCGMGSTITVTNTGTNPIDVPAGATLFVAELKCV